MPPPDRSGQRGKPAGTLTAVASVLLAFPFAILLTTTALGVAGVPVSWLHLPAAALLTAGFAAWIIRARFVDRRASRLLLALGVTAAAFTASALIEARVYDTSWDGQTYHALAIMEMAAGWNPIRQAVPVVPSYQNELEYFAKGPWQLAASVYRVTGSFEAGKAFHVYLVLTAFLFWVAALSTFRGIGRWACFAAVPVALNPISASQTFTYYVDGPLAALIAIVMALLLLTSRQRHPTLFPVLAMALALTVATKLNGALYIAIIAGGFWIWQLSRKHDALVLGAWLLVGLVVGAGILGYNPYTSQFAVSTLAHGNPFHPHAHWESIINLESRSLFSGTGRLGRLGRSLLAPSLIWSEVAPGFKVPFTVSLGELRAFASPDVRFGGFGPLFSGALLMATATLVLLLPRRRRLLPYASLLVLAGSILISVLSFSESWWARLAPQLGLAPALIGVVGILLIRRGPARLVPMALLAILTLNSVLVFSAHSALSIVRSRASEQQLDALGRAGAVVPIADLDGFPGYRYRLDRAGVAYDEAESLPCPEAAWVPLGHLEIFTCDRYDR